MSVKSVEEQFKHDGVQYFLFELEFCGGTNERLGAKDRIQLQTWLDGLQPFSAKHSTTLNPLLRSTECSGTTDLPEVLPPLLPGETIMSYIPNTLFMITFKESDKLRKYISMNLFLTNYKIHLIYDGLKVQISSNVLYSTYKGISFDDLHSISFCSIISVKSTSKTFPGIQLVCKDMRRISLKWKSARSRQIFLYRLHWGTPLEPGQVFALEYYESLRGTFKEQELPVYVDESCGYYCYNPIQEWQRLDVPNELWRITNKNSNYSLVPTYSSVLVVPQAVDDETLIKLTSCRTRKRIPAVSYIYRGNKSVLIRSSQPRRGVTHSITELLNQSRDSNYLDIFASMSPDKRLWIFDSRSFAAAQANRTIGGGFEDYKNTKITFCDIDNIHAVRGSWQNLLELCSKGNRDDPMWLSKLTETGWLLHLYRILVASVKVARKMVLEGTPVLVHCSDGWDRTSQVTSLAMLLMDSYYRSYTGFIK
eukprot:TRINITY_DN12388_c0_g1_i2.p1 TRINITY_DN12388_c0_g1~~TRINITY_DN12388_c0_g1_i2.p1  ORF type:complete len:479 (-),score=76.26 TRINITY_DN12388_c0_g1_i2:99-1535(-)